MRPLEYRGGDGSVLGHYSVAHSSGALAATIGALGHLASVRWAPTTLTAFFVLVRIRVGISFETSQSDLTRFVFRAIVARGFSVDFTTASTAASMAGVANTNKMRASMGTSLMGTAGPRIATTVVMSGQTLTADAAPFAICTVPTIQPVTATGTAAAVPAGFTSPMQTLYEWTGLGQHPLLLTNNEGVIVQPVYACPGTAGVFNLHVVWDWAEVKAF